MIQIGIANCFPKIWNTFPNKYHFNFLISGYKSRRVSDNTKEHLSFISLIPILFLLFLAPGYCEAPATPTPTSNDGNYNTDY